MKKELGQKGEDMSDGVEQYGLSQEEFALYSQRMRKVAEVEKHG